MKVQVIGVNNYNYISSLSTRVFKRNGPDCFHDSLLKVLIIVTPEELVRQ